MIVPRQAAVAVCALAMLLCGCRPYGCNSEQCVKEGPYARAKHCYSVYQTGLHVVRDPQSRSSLRGDASALTDSAMGSLSAALNRGRTLGLPRDTIYRELEREQVAYLRPFTSGAPTPAQYDMLLENLARCDDGEDL